MKKLIILLLSILLSSCAGGQLFVEARTLYSIPLDDKGNINTNDINDIHTRGWQPFNPQIGITYRHYIFDNKRYPKSKPYKLRK